MPSARRPLVARAAVLGLLVALVASASAPFGDFGLEADAATERLGALDLRGFLASAPAYGGSLLLRAPFALAGHLTGARSVEARYLWLALPCLLAAAWLAATAASVLAAAGRGRAEVGATLLLLGANPLTIEALGQGHAEELLVGALGVAAVLAGLRDRPVLAGVLLGAAIGSKGWALLAVVPVLWSLGDVRARAHALASAGVVALALGLPLLLGAPGAVRSAASIATSGGDIVQAWSAWTLMGVGREQLLPPPVWLQALTHPLALGAGIALPLLALPRRRRSDAFLVFSLALLTRCALDTWTTLYYLLPATFALAAHESLNLRRAPVGAAALTMVALAAEGSPQPLAGTATALALLGGAALCFALLIRAPGGVAQVASPAIASTARA